jgi:hypothetical protein
MMRLPFQILVRRVRAVGGEARDGARVPSPLLDPPQATMACASGMDMDTRAVGCSAIFCLVRLVHRGLVAE